MLYTTITLSQGYNRVLQVLLYSYYMRSALYIVYTILNLKLKFKNYLNLSISLELSSITFVATFFTN